MTTKVLVTGAGGFIGQHLVRYLVDQGLWVRGADLKDPEFAPSQAYEFYRVDLRDPGECRRACEGVEHVYALAADMGGIGYISGNHAEIAHNNILINTHTLEASRLAGVRRYFFSSSACVYPAYRQDTAEAAALREDQAFPAAPEEGYGWEKLFAERLCQYYLADHGLATRVARLHNVYGPLGAYDGGREKAPAALCRKVALAADGADLEVWGDGEQSRSFMFIRDCVEGIHRLMTSDHATPLNLGRDDLVTINQLAAQIMDIAGKHLRPRHATGAPQGVRGRNSDNSLARQVLAWEPQVPLSTGLRETYQWVEAELRRAGRL